MKICVVHSFYSAQQPSGENEVVVLQVQALRDAGHEVLLVSTDTDSVANRLGYRLGSTVRVSTGMGRNPLSDILAFAPDVVHIHNVFPNWGYRWIGRLAVPSVLTFHNFRAMCAAGTLFRAGETCTECLSRGPHRSVVHKCYRDSRIATLPLAVGISQGMDSWLSATKPSICVALSQRSSSILRREWAGNAPLVVVPNFSSSPKPRHPADREGWVFVGRFAPEKGVIELLRHWPAEKRLRLVGTGPLDSEVRLLASEMPGVEVVGHVDRAGVSAALAESLGLVFPSMWPETAPSMSYVEAISVGTPTIALAGNSVADDISISGAGKVVEHLGQLGRAIDAVTRDFSEFEAACLRRFEQNFSESVWIDRIQDVYRTAVERGT